MAGERAGQSFAVMAKPAGARCNLRCGYCYYLGRGPEGPDMSPELLETFVREYIQASPGPVVSFTWHGGEPTLAGLNFYRRAVELQKKYLPQGWECWNNLQTNGLLLDEEWCAFLAENRFDVGLSVDGCQAVHDKYRRTPAGEDTYRRTLEAAARLRAHGVRPDLLCTVTADGAEAPLEVYRGLLALDTGWMQFIPIVRRDSSGAVTPDSVSPEGYGEFLCRVFDWWLLHDLGRTEVQLFAEAEAVLAGGSPGLCWMAPSCGRVLVVERDGSVYSCDHFVDTEHRLGRLGEDSLAALAKSSRQRAFGAAKGETLPGACRACRWLELCNGGCPKDRFRQTEDGRINYLCQGLYQFFDHAGERLARLGAYRREGLGAGEILERFRAEEREKWRGVGRNDPCPCGSGKKAKKCCWDRRP